MKECFKCHRLLLLDEFYKHAQMADGHLNKCKECTKKDVRIRYVEKKPQIAAYDRQREQRPERKIQKLATMRRHRAKYPERYRARMAVGNALRDGFLEKKPCAGCGAAKVQAHHSNYAKPYDVVWLCFRCHREGKHGQKILL